MGFHIVNLENGDLQHTYVDSYTDLAFIDIITEDSIIYQGEEHWTPIKVGNSDEYKKFSKDWFRVGLKAQEVFKRQAHSHKLILEELNQDSKSLNQYLIENDFIAIKRGDFLIRNFGNIEVDVKCRSFYESNGKIVFNLKCDDIKRHENMQQFTKIPVIIAVYKRIDNNVEEEDVYFFSINDIIENIDDLKIVHIEKDGTGNCYQIPLDFTVEGFDYIKEIYEKYFPNKTSTKRKLKKKEK